MKTVDRLRGDWMLAAEINKLDVVVENGRVVSYRARVGLSFKYE